MVIVKELTADEVLQLGDKSDYWTFENPNDDTITALIIFDNEGNFFIGISADSHRENVGDYRALQTNNLIK